MESFTLKNFIFTCVSVTVVVISALFLYEPVQNVFCDYAIFERFPVSIPTMCSLFDTNRLSRYDGADGGKIYLSILGTVFDVTNSRRFYGPGGTYHGFAGSSVKMTLLKRVYCNVRLSVFRSWRQSFICHRFIWQGKPDRQCNWSETNRFYWIGHLAQHL